MKKHLLIFASLCAFGAKAQTTSIDTFLYTGSVQIFTVPSCVDSITFKVYGAQGEDALVGGATGGLGGYVNAKMDVSPGDILYMYVGGRSGYNGGGTGGINGNDQSGPNPIGTNGGNGGGGSDIRFNGQLISDRVVVAGGGGGGGHNGVWQGCQVAGPGGNGGDGGGSVGGTGTAGVGTPCNCGGGGGAPGTGGSQAIGGNAGAYAGSTACLRSSWTIGANGMLAVGGTGATSFHNGSGGGGGGGGGFYGGGSAGNGSDTTPGGGGGGGSSFIAPSLTTLVDQQGNRLGDGMIVIAYNMCTGVQPKGGAKYTAVFPNPTTGIVNFTSAETISQINIVNTIGETVYSETMNTTTKEVDLSKLPKGIYFYKIITVSNEFTSGRLVIIQ